MIAGVYKPMTQSDAQKITSPRPRGEVGKRAQRGFRVRGELAAYL
jgi:hypothetical protein